MKIKDLESQNYNGLDYTYLNVGAYSAPNGTIDINDIKAYIMEYSPLIYPASKDPFNSDPNAATDLNPDPNKGTADSYWDTNGWITATLVWKPTKEELIDNNTTDSQIIAKVRAISPDEIFYDVYEQSRLVALAILDNSQVVFQNTIRVVNRTVVDKTINTRANNIGKFSGIEQTQVRYVKEAQIEIRFRRTTDIGAGVSVSQSVTDYLNAVDSRVENLLQVADIENEFGLSGTFRYFSSNAVGKYKADAVARRMLYSLNQQLVMMANWKHPYEDNAMTLVVDPANADSYYPQKLETALNVSAMSDLPPKEFKKVFSSLVKFDYKVHKKKGHWYDKVVSIFILVVAIVLTVASAGSLSEITLPMAAFALSMTALVLTGWSMYLAKNGGSAGAMSFTMNLANVLGIVALVTGIASIWTSWQKSAIEAALKQAIEESVKSGSQEAINSSAAMYVSAIQAGSASAGSVSSIALQGVQSVVELASELDLIDGDVATALSAASGGYNFLASSETTLSKWTMESVLTSLEDGVKKFVSKPLSEIMNQAINWMNAGFNAYISFIAPANEGLADKIAALEASQKEVETTKPEDMDNLWQMYTDPYGSIFEVGDYYDRVYPMLTSGKNRLLMSKCYDSGWKY